MSWITGRLLEHCFLLTRVGYTGKEHLQAHRSLLPGLVRGRRGGDPQ